MIELFEIILIIAGIVFLHFLAWCLLGLLGAGIDKARRSYLDRKERDKRKSVKKALAKALKGKIQV